MSAEMGLQDVAAKATGTFKGLADIFDFLKKMAREELCANKAAIITAADAAIDAVVAIDIPSIPNGIETLLDEMLAKIAKSRVRALIARLCPEPV
jgi:hypothetical protein